MIAPLILFASCIVLPEWHIASGDTALTIVLDKDKMPAVASLIGVNDNYEWCAWRQSEKLASELNGQPAHWQYEGATLRNSILTLTYNSAQPHAKLRSIWRARPGHGPVEHWVEIANRTTGPLVESGQDSLDFPYLSPPPTSDIWWARRGASNALTDGGVFQVPFTRGVDLRLDSNNHDPKSPVPWAIIQDGARRGVYMGWEFSGTGQVHLFSHSNDTLSATVGLMPDFKTDINPGETLTIPPAFIGCYRGDAEEGAYALHRFVQEKLRAPTKSIQDPAYFLNLYLDAGSTSAKEADVFQCIDFAKSIGVEVFEVDAMWFPACGDWRWDPARFPNGAAPIRKAIKDAGMNFGLWWAWGNGGISETPGALSIRGPVAHPDWFDSTVSATWKPGPYYGVQVCAADEEAKAWIEHDTETKMKDWGIEVLKTDVHPMSVTCDKADHRHHFGIDTSFWATNGVYDIWRDMRRANPNLVLENCSGASHIKDFGVVQYCAYTATTDTLSNLPDRAGIWDSTWYLPPALLLTYTYDRGYNQPGDDPGSYLWRCAMMTSWSLDPTDSVKWTPAERADTIRNVKTYKSRIRPILRDCHVHHVLPRPDGKHWDGMFFWSDKLDKGTLFVFRPDCADNSVNVKLKGIKPNSRYRVWSEDGSISPAVASGKELMKRGLNPSLPTTFRSDLIYVQLVHAPHG